MNEEYTNRNPFGTEPDDKAENKEDSRQENTQKEETETSFVMQGMPQEQAKEETSEKQPGETPTEENSMYAYSYKNGTKKEAWHDEKPEANKRTAYDSYRFTSPVPEEPKKKAPRKAKRSSGSMGKRLGSAAAVGLVFGLVAGLAFQGVNYAGNKLMPQQETKQIENTQTIKEQVSDATDVSTGSNSVSQVAKNVMPSIVSITNVSIQEIQNLFGFTQQYEGQSSGSGIIVGQNDTELLIATNNHVVKGANSLTVCFTNQDGTAFSSSDLENTSADSESSEQLDAGTAVEAKVKGTDADNDLAVVAVQLSDIPKDVLSKIKVATLGDSDSLVVGEQVVAIGNALGYGQSLTSGYISALNKKVSSENANSTFIQTDAAINPGNSGGALLNMKGELVGINSAKIAADEVEGMGFAIPISKAQPILDELMSKETRSKVEDENKAAYIGITCKNVTSDASEMYNMPVGIFVDTVAEGGPAEEAGLKAGDIIRKIDGTSVETYDNLTEQLEYYEAGETIDFVISRAESGEYKEQTVSVTLGAKKDAQTNSNTGRSGQKSGR